MGEETRLLLLDICQKGWKVEEYHNFLLRMCKISANVSWHLHRRHSSSDSDGSQKLTTGNLVILSQSETVAVKCFIHDTFLLGDLKLIATRISTTHTLDWMVSVVNVTPTAGFRQWRFSYFIYSCPTAQQPVLSVYCRASKSCIRIASEGS